MHNIILPNVDPLLLLTTAGIFAGIVLIYVSVVFLIAQALSDNSVMDIFYGPAFAVATWTTLWLTDAVSLVSIMLASAVSIWAARLGIRIFRKNWGNPEDARYAAWREKWLKRGRLYFILRSYLQINLLQGIIITVVSLPLIIGITFGPSVTSVPVLFWLGLAVWLGGLLYETIADWQLDRFIARKKAGTTSATLMRKGLFAYSRRPNYFGEALIWWGLAIAALTLPFGYIALAGPALITFILTRVTGPMLEDAFLERYPEAYRNYMATTNYFIPGPAGQSAAPTD